MLQQQALFGRVQYAVRLREFKRSAAGRLDAETEEDQSEEGRMPLWARDVDDNIEDLTEFDSDVSTIENLEGRESELSDDFQELTVLHTLIPEHVVLPPIENLRLQEIPAFILSAYDSAGVGGLIRNNVRRGRRPRNVDRDSARRNLRNRG